MKNVASSETIANTKILNKFQSIVKKITRTRVSKVRLSHISQIVEFLENDPIFDNLRFKWAKEKEDRTARLHSLQLQVYNKSKMAYDILKSRLIDQKLINLSEIESIVAELETLFANNEQNCSPLPWQLAFDGVKTLGIALEKVNRTDLLNDLADFRKVLVRSQTSNNLEFATEEKLIIDHFTFANGVTDLTQLQNDFYFRMEKTPWAIWEKLIAIRWCLKTPFKYWKNKRLRHSSRFYRKEAWQRLNLHAMWAEVNKIKTNSNEGHEFLIQRKLLLKYLQTLSDEVCNYLRVYQSIEQFHFFLQGECLWIVLKMRQKPISYDFFMIKELREFKSLYNFAEALAEAKSLNSVDVPDGYSSSSLLSHLNMPIGSQLALLFLNGWSATQIHFKGNIVEGKTIESQLYIPHLIEELKTLHEQHKSRFFSSPIDAFLSKMRSKSPMTSRNS